MTGKDIATSAIAAVAASTLLAAHVALADDTAPVNARPLPAPATDAPVSFAQVVERVAPAVVSIDVEGQSRLRATRYGTGPGPDAFEGFAPFGDLRRFFPPQRPPPARRGTGSGFFISSDGYVVTNNHVVANAEKITVRTHGDRTLAATLVGRDPATDLAVLKVQGKDFPFVSFEERAKPRVGDWVVAVGNPFNLGGTATAGIVSALSRPNVSGSSYVDYLQIDAAINRGNSGGPTFDLFGRVVGVNSAIFSPSGGSVGIGFAIPADVAARVTRQLIADGKVTRGYMGATIQDVTPEIAESLGLKSGDGALVADVVPDGPGDRAGLRSGDLVLRLGGEDVRSASDLTRRVAQARPGSRLVLDVEREGRRRAVTILAGERPGEQALAPGDPKGADDAAGGGLGLFVSPNPGGGLRIERVESGSDAARKGLRPGDVLQSLGGRPAASADDVRAAVAEARGRGRSAVLARISRNGRNLFVPLAIGRPAG